MKVIVGSTNPIKIEATRIAFAKYERFRDISVQGSDVNSKVSEQPKSLEETIVGAANRAKSAFKNCDYSVGIESGLMDVPFTKSGQMDVCACSIYDGSGHNLGLSEAFEFPTEMMQIIREQGVDANEAAFRAGLTKKRKIGSEMGVIGLLTGGRITRKDYTVQAVDMALLQIINSGLYGPTKKLLPENQTKLTSVFDQDTPACDACGDITVRCGKSYKCLNCGNTMQD